MPIENDLPKILVVDDRKENLFAIETLLKPVGAEVIAARSGHEALKFVLEHHFSLILLDVQMPDMDGFEVARLLKQNDLFKYIPIIFVTAVSREQHQVFKGYECGAVDYLFKPIFPAILMAKVKTFLDLAQKNIELERIHAELSHANKRFMELAHYDPLTNLANRTLFRIFLTKAISEAKRYGRKCALLFLDLDHFKDINDTMGHDAGDLLLCQVALRLQDCCRESDLIARLGGDEFALILGDIQDPRDGTDIAQKILKKLSFPHNLKGTKHFVSSSIGIAICPDDGKDVEGLAKAADLAMYQAKRRGRNTYRFFSQELQNRTQRSLQIEGQLREALKRNEFLAFYQPIIETESGKCKGMEALIRWNSSERGIICPNEFITAAEKTRLILPIGSWILNEASRTLTTWSDLTPSLSLTVAVNLSISQLNQVGFERQVEKVLMETGLEPGLLELEITENAFIKNPEAVNNTLNAIRQLGVKIAIDDFGTGFSSMKYLQELPIDTLKIDQSFIRDIGRNRKSEAIIRAIIALAHNLEVFTVAEGVETAEQVQFLKEHHCDYLQGFHYSRPLPEEEVAGFLAQKWTLG